MSSRQQQCGTCRYADKCYNTTPRNVVINILACRIRIGINVDKSSKLLLKMIRPNLTKLVFRARDKVGNGYIDVDHLILDLESRVIECLLSEDGYRIGEAAYLTEYLFGTNPRTGWVRKWILWNFSAQQRFYKKHTLYGLNPKSDNCEEIPERDRIAIAKRELEKSEIPDQSDKSVIEAIAGIIDDGVTLNANEYRVISFCLTHTNESNRHRLIDGTHTYLSTVMGVSRPRITRLFSVAKRKVLHVAKKRGISL